MRVLQLGRDLDFLEETLLAEGGRDLRSEYLERDLSVVPEVMSQVHSGHATLAELSLDAVAVGQRNLQLFKAHRELGQWASGSGRKAIGYAVGRSVASAFTAIVIGVGMLTASGHASAQ